MPDSSPVILPGSTIGVLGGGQLGRMLAIAARKMGYRVHILDPQEDCPAAQVADSHTVAPYDDIDAAKAFAAGVDVVTFEFENVPAETLAAIDAVHSVYPSPRALDICRHRIKEKTFLSDAGVPVAPFHACHSADDVAAGIEKVGLPCILKTAEFGYDGKGQVKLTDTAQAAEAWESVGGVPCVLEGFVPFTQEVSVIVARNARGQERCFTTVGNEHANHILDVTTAPAPVSRETAEAAQSLAQTIADAIELIGVLAVEMFVVEDGGEEQLIVNELAPRTHNSGHFSFDACVTCQFEQQVRAVCGLPLGDPSLLKQGAAMANLLGDVWFTDDDEYREPNWEKALSLGDVKLHLYGKAEPRRARKMGHLTASAATAEEARVLVLAARASLRTTAAPE